MSMERIVIFSHIPPPHHGQSKMVAVDLSILREIFPGQIDHVDARWSASFEDVGRFNLTKLLYLFRYIWQALRFRFMNGATVLYYVPGPVKKSAVIRDWLILAILRPFFPTTVFHWHAIGQGEWAHGSDRLRLLRSNFLDSIGRLASRVVLARPNLSLVVTSCSDLDARAIESSEIIVVPNCVEVSSPRDSWGITKARSKWLFFSRGTEQKGLLDALEGVKKYMLSEAQLKENIEFTIAGGIALEIETQVKRECEHLRTLGIDISLVGFVTGEAKETLFSGHDVLIFPSHWESFGLVVVEAISAGLVVIAAASDGVRGVLGDDYPYLFPVGDSERLAQLLADCLCSLEKPSLPAGLLNIDPRHFSIERHKDALIGAMNRL